MEQVLEHHVGQALAPARYDFESGAAGFTHVALVQVGADSQDEFISRAAAELLPALASL